MPALLTYWNTLRYLRPTQLYGRVWFHLVKPKVNLRPTPPRRPIADGTWTMPARRRPSLVGPTRFCFLNETRDLADCGWNDISIPKLWRYNLHYFDDLNAEGAAQRRQWQLTLLSRWVRENPPTEGIGWEPYPTSLRIVNWIKWTLSGNRLPTECVESLGLQARWLSRRLETHLLGNHLFTNAKALVFAGLFFEGAEARAWLEKGLRVLAREIPEQILRDGGHFERSTMYHALALEDMLDLCNVSTVFRDGIPARHRATVADWQNRIAPMRDWLASMCHPDGEIGFFNDAAMGVAPMPSELERYAVELGFTDQPAKTFGLNCFPESGYIRFEGDEVVALLDVAPIGPDYLPAHAHADTLSFELSLFGQRIFVNSGTGSYQEGPNRERDRGTAAHNTVAVDEQNSSEVWGSFRVALRAKPMRLLIKKGKENAVSCAHDGYSRLPGSPEHHRQWIFAEESLIVEDRILGPFRRAEAQFHLHPNVKLEESSGTYVILKLPCGQRIDFSVEGGTLRKEAATWHQEFGKNEPSICLVVNLDRPTVRTRIGWAGAA